MTVENCGEVLNAARHCSRKQIELLVARLHPLPDVPPRVRKLPAKTPAPLAAPVLAAPVLAAPVLAASPASLVAPQGTGPLTVPPPLATAPQEILAIAPERFKVQFTATSTLHAKLRHAQDMLRHRIPDGDLSQVFELALNALIERLDKEKFAATDRPRTSGGVAPGSRAIPAGVKRAVWKRDGGQCAFIGRENRRCNETGFLEFHHVVPFARSGEATVDNIALRCRAHNQHEARLDFGRRDLPLVREVEAPWGTPRRERFGDGV